MHVTQHISQWFDVIWIVTQVLRNAQFFTETCSDVYSLFDCRSKPQEECQWKVPWHRVVTIWSEKKATRETRAKQEGTLIQISIGLFAKNEQTKKNWYPANTHNNNIVKGNTVHLAIFPVDFQDRVRPHYTKVVVLSVLFPLWICLEVCAIALKRNWYPTKTQTINTTSKR